MIRENEMEKNKRALYGDNEDPFRVDDVDRDLELTRNQATPSRSGSWDRESRHEAEDDQGGWPDSLGAAPGHGDLAVQPGAEASPLFSPGGDTYVEGGHYDDDNMSFAPGAVGGGAAAASAYHNDDMTMATEAQTAYTHGGGDDM